MATLKPLEGRLFMSSAGAGYAGRMVMDAIGIIARQRKMVVKFFGELVAAG